MAKAFFIVIIFNEILKGPFSFFLTWIFNHVSSLFHNVYPLSFIFNNSKKLTLTYSTVNFLWLQVLKARVLYIANNWIYTTNHKRIAVNYYFFVIYSGIIFLQNTANIPWNIPGIILFPSPQNHQIGAKISRYRFRKKWIKIL